MKNLKRYFPLAFALLFATLASVSVYQYLKDKESVSIAKVDPTVPVVIAKHDLTMGTKISEEDLTVETWPKEIASDHFFHSPKLLIGRTLQANVMELEPIATSKLLGEGENLSKLIPPEMRGVTVPIPKSEGLTKLLERDSIVDVIAIFDNGEAAPSTKVVAQAAHVLAIHNRPEKLESAREPRQMEVTLVVTPREAEWLVVAMNKGTIQLVVRNAKKQVE